MGRSDAEGAGGPGRHGGGGEEPHRSTSTLTANLQNPNTCAPVAKATDVMCSVYFSIFFADFPEKQALVHGGAKRRRGAGGEGGHQNRAVAAEKVRRLGGESPCTQQSRMDR